MNKHDGDIVFRSPTKEFLRFKGDGSILVEGRPVECDEQLVASFRSWLATATLTRPDGAKEKAGLADGDTTFQSGTGMKPGAEGGNVILDNGRAE